MRVGRARSRRKGKRVATIDEETIALAKKHYAVEEGVKDIFVLREKVDPQVVRNRKPAEASVEQAGKTIKLLEVNENTVPAGIAPIQFGPAPASGIHFPSVIVEVTPAEFEQIKAKQLPLPDGWELGERIAKPAE